MIDNVRPLLRAFEPVTSNEWTRLIDFVLPPRSLRTWDLEKGRGLDRVCDHADYVQCLGMGLTLSIHSFLCSVLRNGAHIVHSFILLQFLKN